MLARPAGVLWSVLSSRLSRRGPQAGSRAGKKGCHLLFLFQILVRAHEIALGRERWSFHVCAPMHMHTHSISYTALSISDV